MGLGLGLGVRARVRARARVRVRVGVGVGVGLGRQDLLEEGAQCGAAIVGREGVGELAGCLVRLHVLAVSVRAGVRARARVRG